MTETLKDVSDMTTDEVREELAKAGLLKSNEWFSRRILPLLLKDRKLRQDYAALAAKLKQVEEENGRLREQIAEQGQLLGKLEFVISQASRVIPLPDVREYLRQALAPAAGEKE